MRAPWLLPGPRLLWKRQGQAIQLGQVDGGGHTGGPGYREGDQIPSPPSLDCKPHSSGIVAGRQTPLSHSSWETMLGPSARF